MTRMLYSSLVRDGPVERRDDVADAALALGVQRLERDDVRLRRDGLASTVRLVTVAGDDAGDMRAVTPVVVLGRAAVDEIDKRGDALSRAVRNRQVLMAGRDAGVDHRDADAGAGVTVLDLHVLGADGGGSTRDRRFGFAIDVNALDLRVVSEPLQQRVGHAARSRLDVAELPAGNAAGPFDAVCTVRVVVELHDDFGIADTVGDFVQLFVQFGMLDLSGFPGLCVFLRIGGRSPDEN